MENKVKILFKLYNPVLEQEIVETMWADIADMDLNYYKIDSIPCYTSTIATDDIVHAEYNSEDEMLVYIATIEHSGNSTIWIVVINEAIDIEEVRDLFYDFDCISEALSDRYFTMEVKATTNYLRVKDKLNELKAEGLIDYVEACLSREHQY